MRIKDYQKKYTIKLDLEDESWGRNSLEVLTSIDDDIWSRVNKQATDYLEALLRDQSWSNDYYYSYPRSAAYVQVGDVVTLLKQDRYGIVTAILEADKFTDLPTIVEVTDATGETTRHMLHEITKRLS